MKKVIDDQTAIQQGLAHQKDIIHKLETSLYTNAETMRKNMDSLERRFINK
jgi:hypothetical protein